MTFNTIEEALASKHQGESKIKGLESRFHLQDMHGTMAADHQALYDKGWEVFSQVGSRVLYRQRVAPYWPGGFFPGEDVAYYPKGKGCEDREQLAKLLAVKITQAGEVAGYDLILQDGRKVEGVPKDKLSTC